MWSGFITGFAEKSVSLIEERDKEIRAGINRRIEDMYKQASVAKKKAEERRETLTSLANQLMGVGFSRAEAELLIDNPEQAESIIKLVEATPNKMADPETKRKLFAPAQERLAGVSGEKLIDKINKISTPQRSGIPTILPSEMRGAFGLPSGAEDYVKTLGLKEEDLATELPARGVAQPLGLDMSVFKETESTESLKNRMRDILANEDQADEAEFERLKKQLEASVIVKAMTDFEEKKPRSASEIRSIFKDSLREALDPYVIGGVAQVTQTGDVVPITGDPQDIAKFRASRAKVIREIAINRNLFDPRTNEVVNEEAEDALIPYADIQDGKIVGWKTGAAPIKPRVAPKEGDESTDTNNKKIVFRNGKWVYP